MKTCTKCQAKKPLEDFVCDKRRTDGRGSWCTLCNRAYMRALIKTPKQQAYRKAQYEANKESLNAQARARWVAKKDQYQIAKDKWAQGHRDEMLGYYKSRGAAFRVWIDEVKKDRPCADCGKVFAPYIMEFDHVLGEKRFSLGKMANHRREAVEAELAKCDLVCCACHRVRTQMRKGDSKIARVRAFREWLNELKRKPCQDCGRTRHHAAMDFDYARGTKITQIADMWSWGRQRVIDEITKCDLVCANCHRERTQVRRAQLRCPRAGGSPCAHASEEG